MIIKAYAKLNFYLEILSKRPDGYHNLQSIMQKISLHDVLMFKKATTDQLLYGNKPLREDNLVVRALHAVRQVTDVPPVQIILEKHIPIGAGLGGGSSDAASVIEGLDQFFTLNLSHSQKHRIASSLGSDVPFFLSNEAALVEGTGTDISPLPAIDLQYILLARPKGKISTIDVYKNLEPTDYDEPGNLDEFTEQWKSGILGKCFNHLEGPAFRLDSRVETLKNDMIKTKPLQCLMTGSGNVVFAVYETQDQRTKAIEELKQSAKWIMTTHTIKG